MRTTPKVRNRYPSERGDKKRALRAAAMAKVSEVREPKFMHSAARMRLTGEYPRPMTGFLATMTDAQAGSLLT